MSSENLNDAKMTSSPIRFLWEFICKSTKGIFIIIPTWFRGDVNCFVGSFPVSFDEVKLSEWCYLLLLVSNCDFPIVLDFLWMIPLIYTLGERIRHFCSDEPFYVGTAATMLKFSHFDFLLLSPRKMHMTT